MSAGICTTDGCDRPWHARGLCNTHYQRRIRRRIPLPPPLQSAEWALHGHPYVARQDIDELAVTLVVDDGHRMPLRVAERAIAVLRLLDRDLSPAQVADRVGVSERTVFRWQRRRQEVSVS